MLGYEFASGQDKPIVHVDWTKIIDIKGKLATARLPDQYVPMQIGAQPTLFGFDFCYVSLPSINVSHSAHDLETEWITIEANGVPLNLMSECLVAFDILRLLACRFVPSMPAWISLPELVSLVAGISNSGLATNFDARIRAWAKLLRREANQAQTNLGDSGKFFERVHQLGTSLASCLAEFRVMERLVARGNAIEIRRSGAEFILYGDQLIKVEVKTRLKLLPTSLRHEVVGDRHTLESLANPPGYLVALSLLLVDKFAEAFDDQKCDLLFEDISHTFLGWLLAASVQFWEAPLTFNNALQEGLETVSHGEKAVIAYVYTVGPTGRIYAISLTRTQAEQFAEAGRDVLRLLTDKPDARTLVDVFSRLLLPDQ